MTGHGPATWRAMQARFAETLPLIPLFHPASTPGHPGRARGRGRRRPGNDLTLWIEAWRPK